MKCTSAVHTGARPLHSSHQMHQCPSDFNVLPQHLPFANFGPAFSDPSKHQARLVDNAFSPSQSNVQVQAAFTHQQYPYSGSILAELQQSVSTAEVDAPQNASSDPIPPTWETNDVTFSCLSTDLRSSQPVKQHSIDSRRSRRYVPNGHLSEAFKRQDSMGFRQMSEEISDEASHDMIRKTSKPVQHRPRMTSREKKERHRQSEENRRRGHDEAFARIRKLVSAFRDRDETNGKVLVDAMEVLQEIKADNEFLKQQIAQRHFERAQQTQLQHRF